MRQAEHLRLQAALIENAHDAIIVRDGDVPITFWNMGAERLYGWTEAEALGRNVHELLATSRAQLEAVDGTEIRARVAKRPDAQAQGWIDHRRGQPPGARWREGPPGAVLEINRDVSDRKRAEEQRAEVMARLAVLLEVSESLSAAATPEEIVEIVLEKAVPALGAYAGGVAVLTQDGTEVEVLVRAGTPRAAGRICPHATERVDAAVRCDSHRGQRGRVFARGMAIPLSSLPPNRVGTESRALAAIPLRGSRIVGAIGLSFRDARELSSRDRTSPHCWAAGRAGAGTRQAARLGAAAHADVNRPAASRTTSWPRSRTSCAPRSMPFWAGRTCCSVDALPPERSGRPSRSSPQRASQVRLVDEVLDISRMSADNCGSIFR